MKDLLKKKLFGKIPVWVVLLVVMALAYIAIKRRGPKTEKENAAESANYDGTQPFPYSSPDMFPLQGPGGVSGPTGSAGPTGSSSGTASGMRATKTRAQLMADYRAGLKRRHPTYSTARLTALVRARFPLLNTTAAPIPSTSTPRPVTQQTSLVGNTPKYPESLMLLGRKYTTPVAPVVLTPTQQAQQYLAAKT